jgi:acetylornithine deacetylase/succinyl-diaminopimelate desuccinylase-like protein
MLQSITVIALLALASGVFAQDTVVRQILDSAAYKKAAALIEADEPRFVKELIELTEIPAPPFKEARRAKAYLEMLRQAGLEDVEMDAEGNVMGVRRGSGGGQMVAVVAHIDTVFPEGTDVKVKRDGVRLAAPGVGDNTRGIALMLSVARAVTGANVQTTHDILFVGNVGEEGEGDLRGVKFLLQKGKYKDRIRQFIAIDGGDQSTITRGGVGSRRYRVSFKGPGGHSYGAFGIVNPMTAMSQAVVDFYRTPVPANIKTTYSASVTGGGTSVNSIPNEVWMDFDMRSESADELAKLEKSFLATMAAAAEKENAARSTAPGRITVETKVIGDRPAGQTDPSADIVQLAAAAYRREGVNLQYRSSSTDANLPISLGIPAITMSRVVRGERAHALDEWIGIEKEPNVKLKRIGLATILAVAGAQ